MYQNIFNSLIAVASLAMMAAADYVTVEDVTPTELYLMSKHEIAFVLDHNETLTLQMDTSAD